MGTIAIVLAGAFPLVFVITKLLRKPLMAAGRWLASTMPDEHGQKIEDKADPQDAGVTPQQFVDEIVTGPARAFRTCGS